MKYSFKDFYTGQRPLKNEDELIRMLARKFKASPETTVNKIYLYKSPDKQSLLVRLGDKIAKVYDSKDMKHPVINWSTDLLTFKSNIDALEILPASKIRFPNKIDKTYAFDKNLFANQNIKEQIKVML
jgi:hypothetical protein